MRTVFSKEQARRGFTLSAIAVVGLAGAASFGQVAATPNAADRGDVPVLIYWDGAESPSGVNGPHGERFDKKGSSYEGTVARPNSTVEFADLEVAYGGHGYPVRVRVNPQSRPVPVTVALNHPKSCADVYLKKLEITTSTPIESIRAAFTLGYMIDGRAGENSCEGRQLRSAKARFERYQNAMERSETLAIPDSVKEALRKVARTDRELREVDQIIAIGEAAEKRKVASSLQRAVLASVKTGDISAAFLASTLLNERSKTQEYSAAVASQITPEALEKQTLDLGLRVEAAERRTETPPRR